VIEYAEDTASADGQRSIGLLDVENAWRIIVRASDEARPWQADYLVSGLPQGSVAVGRRAIDEDGHAAALARLDRQADMPLPIDPVAAEWLALRSAVLHAAALEADVDPGAVLAHWSFFGFKRTGTTTLPTIASRARAQSLKYLRHERDRHDAPASIDQERKKKVGTALRRVWTRAQGYAHQTQFLLTGTQMRRAISESFPDAPASAAASSDRFASTRLFWGFITSMTEKALDVHKRGVPGALWLPVDPNAARLLAGLGSDLAARKDFDVPPLPGPPERVRYAGDWFEEKTSTENFAIPGGDAQDLVTVGAVCLDADGDGDQDLFIGGGRRLGSSFWRNEGEWRFTETTALSGLDDVGMRGAAGDYDGDGKDDLIVVGDAGGETKLFRSNGDGTFEDRTEALGLDDAQLLAETALWFDYDSDGDLDLYIVYLGDYHAGRLPDPDDPSNGLPNRLLRNRGDGTFEDATTEAGLGDSHWGWAAAVLDANDDGRPDLFLCNGFGPSRLMLNSEGGRFIDGTSKSGIEILALCNGVSVADFDRDGVQDLFLSSVGTPQDLDHDLHGKDKNPLFDPDLFSSGIPGTKLRWQSRLYRGSGGGRFEGVHDERVPDEIGWAYNGLFLDADRDGWQDLFVVNGFYPDVLFFHDEEKVFARYDPKKARFVSKKGHGAHILGCSRGSLHADLDKDGCEDLLLVGLHGPRVFKGRCPGKNRWLALDLRSQRGARGASVLVETSTGRQRFSYGLSGGGNVHSGCGPLTVGLGRDRRARRVTIRWPSGQEQVLKGLRAGRSHLIEEPAGRGG